MFYEKQNKMMYFSCLMLLLISSNARAGNGTDNMISCDGVVFNNVYYDREILFEGLSKPYNLVVQRRSGYLFFSHTIQNGTLLDFGIMACHLKKKTCRDIPGIQGGYAVAHDRSNNDIFFGGHNGIYKYHFRKKRAVYFAEKGKSIWSIFIRNHFYYIEYPSQTLYIYKRRKFYIVAAAVNIEVDSFFVSKNSQIYFSNLTGLYKVEKIRYRTPYVLHNNITIRQISENIFGEVFFCATDGIYMEDKFTRKAKKIADIQQPYGLAFINSFTSYDDTTPIIYSDINIIYILTPSKYRDMCLDAIINDGQKILKKRPPRVLNIFAH